MALDPSGLPQLDDGASVRTGAKNLQTAVGKVAARATSIQTTWSKIVPHYDAPEDTLVHTAMKKPVTAADTLVTKTGTAASALSDYGNRLDELNTQRTQLVSDMNTFNTHRDKVTQETNGFLGWKEWTGWEKQDLLNQEEDLNDRASAFAAAVDEAQRTCANAINAIFGGPQYKAADRASVDDPNVYGLSQDGYDQMGLSGKNAWGSPKGWTDTSWMSASYMLGRGAVRSITGLWDMGKALTGFGEDGEASAAWSGLWQLAKDAMIMTAAGQNPGMVDQKQMTESSERLLGVLKSIVGIGTWKTSGWNTAGGFVPDIVIAIFTAGGGAVAKSGLRGAAKGALEGALARLAPATATKIGDLNTAMRVAMRTRYTDALTGIRDLGYRGIDSLGDVRRAAKDIPNKARDWSDDLGRKLNPDPVPSTGPRRVPSTTRGPDHTSMLSRTTHPGDWPSQRPHSGTSASHPGTAAKPIGKSGMMDSAPHSVRTEKVDVDNTLMPKAGEAFGAKGDLLPSTRYEVRGRGAFYTNAEGVVEFVEPMRKKIGLHEFMSSDLRHPLPNVTYKVDDYAYYHTDDLGRTDHVHVDNLELRPGTKMSRAANLAVTKGRVNLDAGHLLARGTGGAREEINLVEMVRELNRGHGGRSLAAGNSVRHLELELEKALRQPGNSVSFDLRVTYGQGARPVTFRFAPTLTTPQGGPQPMPLATQIIQNR
ncbi:MAG: DNA/RNA non-specific endonuclease [Propionibacteriaceae bacterium]